MKADPRFVGKPLEFWANVRTIGQEVGYTVRGEGIVRVPTLAEVQTKYKKIGLSTTHLVSEDGSLTPFGMSLFEYFAYRARILNECVEPNLMDLKRAKRTFTSLKKKLRPKCPLPMNKQKKEKKAPAYLTGIVNMLVESNSSGHECDFDPHTLTSFASNGVLQRTFSRRLDGAFPSTMNPIAIWEIKEYYYTTTFGSRIADGVYETLLDGMEMNELETSCGRHVEHLLIVDAYVTWWKMGKSYLCRLIDMLHMGYVDELLFGYEVVERLPEIVQGWVKQQNH